MEGMGEETLSFPLLKSGKRQKVHLGRSVSTHYAADCRFQLVYVTGNSKNSNFNYYFTFKVLKNFESKDLHHNYGAS